MKLCIHAVLACLLFLLTANARAATVNCTISAVGPNFGVYDPFGTSDTPANGSVTTSCTLSGNQNPVTVVSSYSPGSSGTNTARTMRSGANQLSYNLYFDAAFKQICGDGTGGSQTGSATFSWINGNPQQSTTATIYGNVPKLQDVAPGSYTDTITVTITF
jgi:spore coat protein U-like protein